MQDPKFDRGVWVVVQYGDHTIMGHVQSSMTLSSTSDRDAEEMMDEVTRRSVLRVYDALEFHFFIGQTQQGVTKQTLVQPIGVALEPITINVRPDSVTFFRQLERETCETYQGLYKQIIEGMKAARLKRNANIIIPGRG